jgi:hypothetical protein
MNRFVVGIPLTLTSTKPIGHQFNLSDGWPETWADSGKGLTRQLSKLGNQSFSSAKITEFEIQDNGVELFTGVTIFKAIQVNKKNAFNQLILLGEISVGSEKLVHELRSPGQSKTKERIKQVFGLDTDESNTVYATTAFSGSTAESSFKNGLIFSSSKNKFAFDITNSLMISAICAERIILESATNILFRKDFMALQSRRHLNRLNNWISVPSSDSTRILSDVEYLRASLHLSERTAQVTKALSNRTKSVDYSFAAFFGTLGFTNAAFREFSTPDAMEPYLIATQIGLSFVASAFVFSIIRRS